MGTTVGIVLAVSSEATAQWGALAGVGVLFGTLLRVLSRSDDRWQRLVDAEQASRATLAAELVQATADRDYWRARAIACEGGGRRSRGPRSMGDDPPDTNGA